ncbi:hypothetical protein FPSE_08865 [Fusarium pseudograminearum CS3096]|uniref:Uncharacterized protein n=2 Tax=Fusarium pseudograminearum TaxID=101028 RepID=K3UGL2_FUSPC|nr:hypothetical protein FPSE_08865 [Fusarium pseudograminearum CS3096]EKJ70951.1 hypothetical protein FPSE_08865 [Fusarium pseudograminearum CS3096]CEG02581.1 unnamed protein product [Fusarium pseudograminearum CS3427]CEG02825.1 unnamed protein product [Fusarium pseudograminearum CS3427]
MANSVPNLPIGLSYVVPSWFDDKVFKLGEDMKLAWEPINAKFQDDPEKESKETIEYRDILRDAYREYQLLFKEKEKMHENGTFLSSIASAMAENPFANKLEITDVVNRKEDVYLIERDYRTSVRAVMLAPHTWFHASNNPNFVSPVEFLHKLPAEIHKAGTTLQELSIQCSEPRNSAKLRMSPSEKTSLIESIQNLKSLTFNGIGETNGGAWFFGRQPDSRDIALDFISTLLQPSGLDHLTLVFSKFAPVSCSVSEVMKGAHHEGLKQLCLSGATWHPGELGQYLVHIKGPCDVTLKSVVLLSGKWEEEVDNLRSLSTVSIQITDLSGAEFDDQQFRVLWAPEGEIALNRYLQRATSVNPFTNKNIE